MMELEEFEHEGKIVDDLHILSSPESGCNDEGVLIRKPLTPLDKILVGSFSVVCFWTSVLLMLLITAATIIRYVVQGDLYGYDEWAKLLAIWLYFMGAAYGAFNESHVTADLVVAFIRDGVLRRALIVLKDVISVSVCLLYLWYGYDFFFFALRGPLGTGVAIPTTSVWRIPMWYYNLAIFLGLAFIAFYLIKYFLRDLFMLWRALGKKEGETE